MTAPTIDPVSQRIVGIATVTTLEFPAIPGDHAIRSHRRPSTMPMHAKRAGVALFTALVLVAGTLGLSIVHGGPEPATPPPTMVHP